MRIDIYPLEKITTGGLTIALGMTQTTVEQALGKGEAVGSRHYYFQNEMAIDYDQTGRVEFVEFLGGIDGTLRPCIDGISIFDTPADALTALLKEKNSGVMQEPEPGYTCLFPEIGIGLHRDIIPEDVDQMEKEMKADGIPVTNHADLEKDRHSAAHWLTIGMGGPGYY